MVTELQKRETKNAATGIFTGVVLIVVMVVLSKVFADPAIVFSSTIIMMLAMNGNRLSYLVKAEMQRQIENESNLDE